MDASANAANRTLHRSARQGNYGYANNNNN